ncbi:AAA family ATPase [Candidatus Sumerlaeota bacterium]|nr:AAA family ATPase [Candidatus Sumerlaeota bacterium]
MGKKILISGRAGADKTTLIEKLAGRLGAEALRGFYTTELQEGDKRAGFDLNVIGGVTKNFAHVNMSASHRVGKYGVDLKLFEEYALPEIEEGMQTGATLLIDEIGKMELLSIRFKRCVLRALDSDCDLVATVMSRPHPFIEQLRTRKDVEWLPLTETNEDIVLEKIIGRLEVKQ